MQEGLSPVRIASPVGHDENLAPFKSLRRIVAMIVVASTSSADYVGNIYQARTIKSSLVRDGLRGKR